jgi:hypothetical protein
MKPPFVPLITYVNGAWVLCWILYWLGHAVSKTLNITDGWTFPAYSWLMLASSDVQDGTWCAGPWGDVVEE